MKKLSTILMCVVLCMALVFSMTACGDNAPKEKSKDAASGSSISTENGSSGGNTASVDDTAGKTDEELIVGKWAMNLDFGEIMAIQGADTDDDEMTEMYKYFDLDKLSLAIYFDFKADGTAAYKMEKADLEKFADDYLKVMTDGMGGYLNALMAELGVSLEDYLTEYGMTEQQFIDAMIAEMDADELVEEMSEMVEGETGYYQFKDGKLYMGDDMDFDEYDAVQYTINSKELVITKEGMAMTLTRQ